MKILKMKLENFQGVKELEIDPQGESSAIYGDNGTGKSTVYNAFTWLMYGKPSTTEKNYTPKTTGSHNLHHSVEMTVELADGSEMVLKKDYHEVYKTIKGNPQPVLSGHTTDYSMDGVPVASYPEPAPITLETSVLWSIVTGLFNAPQLPVTSAQPTPDLAPAASTPPAFS